MTRIRIAPVVLTAALALFAFTGCSSASGSSADGSTGSMSMQSTADGARVAEQDIARDMAQAPEGVTLDRQVAVEQQVISTVDVTLQAAHPDEAAEQVADVAKKLGGSVESLSIYRASGDSPAGSNLTVRVSPDKLDEAIAQFAEIGELTSQTRSAQDVTTEYVDLEARIEALETSVKRLNDLMAGAETTSDLIEAEGALTQRQQELDGLRAQFKALDGQVSEATIWVSIVAPSVLPGGGPSNFWEGIVAGVSSLFAAGSGALVLLGVALPWLAIAAIVTTGIIAITRARKSRRSRAEQPVPPTPTQP